MLVVGKYKIRKKESVGMVNQRMSALGGAVGFGPVESIVKNPGVRFIFGFLGEV